MICLCGAGEHKRAHNGQNTLLKDKKGIGTKGSLKKK